MAVLHSDHLIQVSLYTYSCQCAGVSVSPLPHTGSTAHHHCAAAAVVLHWPRTKLPTGTAPAPAATAHTVFLEQHLHVLKVRSLQATTLV